MTWSDKLTHHNILMINIMSPITTSIRTITRKSVNMVAELGNGTALWTVGSVSQRLEGNSVVTKVLHAIALKTPSEFGSYTVVNWMQWFGVPTLAGGSAAVRMPGRRLALQSQEQHIQLHEDQLTTDTADLKMTEDALAEDTAPFEDTTQDCLAIQAKVADFEAYSRSLFEELKALTKAVISEKTGDAEYRDNRSVLSSRGGLAGELIKSENWIKLAQLTSRADSAMHGEISNGDDPFAKVKGLISDMSTRLEEKASADATHKATSNVYTVVHRTDGLKTIAKRVHSVSQLFSFFNETYFPEDVHAIINVLKEAGVKSTATPAQLTVDGEVSEAFARTKLFMQQHKSSETSMISLGPDIMKLNSVVYPHYTVGLR